MYRYAICLCSLHVALFAKFPVCLHCWLARETCKWQWQVQADSTDKTDMCTKSLWKFLEWLCMWCVEGVHCYVHVILILPHFSYTFHVHWKVRKKTRVCTVYLRREICPMPFHENYEFVMEFAVQDLVEPLRYALTLSLCNFLGGSREHRFEQRMNEYDV